MQRAGVARVQLQRAQEMLLQIGKDRRRDLPERFEIHDIAAVRGQVEMGLGAVLFQYQRSLGSLLSTLVPLQLVLAQPIAESQAGPRHPNMGQRVLLVKQRRLLVECDGAEE